MKTSVNKMMKKLEHQNKVNPGHKTSYEQPSRPRATVFKSKKAYNRQAANLEFRRIIHDN